MEDQDKVQNHRFFAWLALVLAGAAAVATLAAWMWRRRQAETLQRRQSILPAVPPGVHGLTQAEAEARRVEGQDNAIYFKPPRTKQQIWRENVYTIFNFSLVGLAVAQLILGELLGALLSLGTIALNIGLNIAQEYLAQRRLRDVVQATRPRVTVVREGKTQSVDPGEIVLADILVVGPGDQILVDGEIVGENSVVVDETMLSGKGSRTTKGPGDKVYAGSFCVSGRAVYEAQRLGQARLIVARIADSPAVKDELTPLERIVERVLSFLLVLVGVFTVLLLSTYFQLDTTIGVDVTPFTNAISVIFNIAPSSLYFLIILAYAAGTADLAKVGALVHRARSVESLAQASVICFAQAGILTGSHMEMDLAETPSGSEPMARSRIQQIVGDFAYNTSVDNLVMRALSSTFEGGQRSVREEAPFLSVYGWSAIAFDDVDLHGVYVLGEKEVLAFHLAAADGEKPDMVQDGSAPGGLQKLVSPLGRLFRRSKPAAEADEALAEQPSEPEPLPLAEGAEDNVPKQNIFRRMTGRIDHVLGRDEESADEAGASEEAPQRGLLQRLSGGVNRLLRRDGDTLDQDLAEEEPLQETVFMFAYCPELEPLHSSDGLPRLPEGLLPLCDLRYSERVRPEAVEDIKMFSATGVSIKAFTAHQPEPTVEILKQAGLGADRESPLGTLTGPELAEMDAGQLARAAVENTVFGLVSPEQSGAVVAALRRRGESVVVVGDRVSDLPAMRQANLAIARQSSSQSALSVADIVLLGDSPGVLGRVLDKGQRIGHGLMDVLKLNLTQVFYIALMIFFAYLVSIGFPFNSGHVTVINIITVALPAAGLSLWAAGGVLPRTGLGTILFRVVLPAAVVMSIAATVVYQLFLERSDVLYAQLTVAYTLVFAGLLLVILIRPPLRFGPGLRLRIADWRPTALVSVLFVLFFVVAAIPLAQKYLYLSPLQRPEDYAIVGTSALASALILSILWLILPSKAQK